MLDYFIVPNPSMLLRPAFPVTIEKKHPISVEGVEPQDKVCQYLPTGNRRKGGRDSVPTLLAGTLAVALNQGSPTIVRVGSICKFLSKPITRRSIKRSTAHGFQ